VTKSFKIHTLLHNIIRVNKIRKIILGICIARIGKMRNQVTFFLRKGD